MKKIIQNVLKTLIFFDVLEKPLTKKEIWQYLLFLKVTEEEVQKTLSQLLFEAKIETKSGFYFLKGRKGLVDLRNKKEEISKKFQQEARQVLKPLKTIPFLKMVMITSSLSHQNAKATSDVDILVFGEKNHLRLVRDLVLWSLQSQGRLMRQRSDKLKFSADFFVVPEKANFEFLLSKKESFTYYYWLYWVAFSIPIISSFKDQQIFQRQNSWLKKYLPNFIWPKFKKSEKSPKTKKLLESFFMSPKGQKLEKLFASKQKIRLEKYIKKMGPELAINRDDLIMQFSHKEMKWQKLEKKFEKLLTKYRIIW